MAFTAGELANIANATLDFHLRGQPVSQVKQARPLYDALMKGKKSFPGGKEYITGPVKGSYTSAFVGYDHDDTQVYANPANVKRWQAQWFELGAGISVTYTELKKNGISVEDSKGTKTTSHSDAELVRLVNLLEDKLEDLTEGSARSLAEIFWRDGTQAAKVPPGILSFIKTSNGANTTGTTFGLDRGTFSWWRNRLVTGLSTATPSDQVIVQTLQKEFRQLRRYGTPQHSFYCGSDFLDAFEKELRAKGNYTLEGWSKTGKIDASVADVAFKGIALEYEPLLDDLSLAKWGFVLDLKAIKWQPMEGEENKMHTPERPPEKYALYRAITTTGGVTANQLNTSGAYSIA